MAYSYDRRYHSGRHGSYYQSPRQHDSYSPSPSSPYDPSYASMPTTNPYSYDPRYSYAPPPSRTAAYPDRRRKQPWPPSPSVETERDALAREIRDISLSDESSGEGCSRGTVDQEPIMLEVEQPKSDHNDDRRFVLVGHGSDDVKPTPASRDSRRRSFAERGNISHLNTDVHETSIPFRREPSPYTISKPGKGSPRKSVEYFLSPETITPQISSVPRSFSRGDSQDGYRDQNYKPEKPKSQHKRYDSIVTPKTSQPDLFDDSDLENDDSASLRVQRRPARYSFVKGDLQKEDLRTSLNGPGKDPRSSPQYSDPRLANDHSYNGSSSSPKTSAPPPPSPRTSSSALHNVSAPRQIPQSRDHPHEPPYARSPRYQDNHGPPGSPLVKDQPWPRSPPRSPTVFRDSPPRAQPLSRPNSKPSSRASSPLTFNHTVSMPPPSPTPMDVKDIDWNSTYPPVTRNEQRSDFRPTSRHSRQPQPSMIVPPRINAQSPLPARPPKTAATLPYPVDDLPVETFMPSEEQYQFQAHPAHAIPPTVGSSGAYPRSPIRTSPLPSPIHPRSRDNSISSHPSGTSRHPATEDAPRSRPRSSSTRSSSAYDGRGVDKSPAPLTLEKPLPPCPRANFSDNHNDWYTLENCRDFDICPSCYDAVFASTPFAPYFSQTRLHQPRQSRNCDFSSPWVRLAWLLSIKQKRNSLDLIYRLATIRETSDPCPGSHEVPAGGINWYGIKDAHGAHVAKFALCPCDLKQIEALLPSLRGMFTRLHSSDSRRSYTCALRTQSRRFPAYLDLLVELDAESTRRSRSPDIRPFIALARENAYKQECTRDTLLVDATWHFHPLLPDFAVCEECYDAVIWPEVKKAVSGTNNLAAEFNATLQFVPGETSQGTSCQLYSPRMRRVWRRAVEDGDFGYLKRKAVERRGVELDLQRQSRAVERALEGERRERERASLRRQAGELARVWGDWE